MCGLRYDTLGDTSEPSELLGDLEATYSNVVPDH